MTARTIIKLGLSLGGIIVFGIGIRVDNQTIRWAGVACVVVAWLLRFWKAPVEPR